MDKFTFGTFQSGNTDIAFTATNGYDNPASEQETRKQLSYPLKELKEYINNTVSIDGDGNAIQLIVNGGSIQYKSDASQLSPTDLGYRKITIGTADPSGGSNGDVYIQYEE